MHILMITIDYPPIVGGVAAHVFELSKALVSQGHKVSIVTIQHSVGDKEVEVHENITLYRFKKPFTNFMYGFLFFKFIKKIVATIKPDILHSHTYKSFKYYDLKGVPLVYTNHTSTFLKALKKGPRRVAFLKKVFNVPQLILAPSEELLDFPFEVFANKVYIPNGVDSEKFQVNLKVREKIRQEFKLTASDKLAIVTRRMVKKNGVKDLALATEYIKSSNLKLLLIGDGEEFSEVSSILEESFRGRYFLLGSKTHSEIINYYHAADLSILPSLMEATSISGLEAMASSLALVGTDVGGIPDIIREGYNGYLCEASHPISLAKTIDKILEKDLEQLGRNSLQLIKENFDWSNIANQTLENYHFLLEQYANNEMDV